LRKHNNWWRSVDELFHHLNNNLPEPLSTESFEPPQTILTILSEILHHSEEFTVGFLSLNSEYVQNTFKNLEYPRLFNLDTCELFIRNQAVDFHVLNRSPPEGYASLTPAPETIEEICRGGIDENVFDFSTRFNDRRF
jgi:hypothetical protein